MTGVADGLRLRVEVTKKGRMRYLSHAEFSRTMMFAARRSGLPLLYKGKYRSRLKISLSPPLPIGITSDGELLDLSLSDYVSVNEAERALQAALPGEMEIKRCRIMGRDSRPVGKLIDTALYDVFLPQRAVSEGDWQEAVEEFLKRQVVEYERVQPRRTRVLNLREGVHGLEFIKADDRSAKIRMIVDDGTRGTVKPREVLEVLAGMAGLGEDVLSGHSINRLGLYARRGDRLVSPMDLKKGRPAV